MRDLAAQPGLVVDACYGVHTGERSYQFEDVRVLPVTVFLEALHAGRIF